jgi:hypothetical protein
VRGARIPIQLCLILAALRAHCARSPPQRRERAHSHAALSHTCRPALCLRGAFDHSPTQAKEIEELLGPDLYDVYASNLKLKIAPNGRGAAVTGGTLPAPPKLALAPGQPLEKSGTLKRPSGATSTGPMGESVAREVSTHR